VGNGRPLGCRRGCTVAAHRADNLRRSQGRSRTSTGRPLQALTAFSLSITIQHAPDTKSAPAPGQTRVGQLVDRHLASNGRWSAVAAGRQGIEGLRKGNFLRRDLGHRQGPVQRARSSPAFGVIPGFRFVLSRSLDALVWRAAPGRHAQRSAEPLSPYAPMEPSFRAGASSPRNARRS